MTEVGVGFVRLVPSMKGFSREANRGLADGLKRPAKRAGEAGGREMASGLSSGLDGSKGKFSAAFGRIGSLFKAGLAGAALAGGAILAKGVSDALELEVATDKLEAQLGGGPWAAEAAGVASRLYQDAFGDNMAEVADGVRQVLQAGLVPEDSSLEFFEDVTEKALTFADVLDQDLGLSVDAVGSIIRTGLADNAEDAFDILTRGIQGGGDKSGDLLETFQEYPTAFRELGLSGDEAMGLLLQGMRAGARDSDKVADALKEIGIRGQDLSDTSREAFTSLGLNADEMFAKFAAGGPQSREALGQVLDSLREIEDPAIRNAAAVGLFGTQAEDLGDALFNLDLDRTAVNLGETEGATEGLASAYDNAATRIESFKRKALNRLTTFVGGTVIPGIERLAEVLGPPISEALTIARDLIGEVLAAFSSGDAGDGGAIANIGVKLREFVTFLQEDAWPAIQTVIAALTAAWEEHGPAVLGVLEQVGTIAQDTVKLILAIVARAVDVITFIWTNWGDEIMAVISVAWEIISGIISGALDIIQGIIRTATALLTGDWSGAWEGIKQILSGVWGIIGTIITGALDLLLATMRLSLAVLGTIFSAAWDAIVALIDLAWEGIKTVVTNQFTAVKNLVTGAWDEVATLFSDAWEILTTIVSDGFDAVLKFFTDFPGNVTDAFSSLAGAIKSPFESAFNSIKSLWNRTVGGFSVNVPGFLGFDGVSFSIPTMHTGGIFRTNGSEGLALLQDGEGVLSRDQMAAIGAADTPAAAGRDVIISADNLDRALLEWLRRSVRVEGGGSVQVALGQR